MEESSKNSRSVPARKRQGCSQQKPQLMVQWAQVRGSALWEWAAGEQGGCEGDRVLGIRVGRGHGLVTQGLAALPSTCTCPEGSVGPMCPRLCCWPQGTGQSPTPPWQEPSEPWGKVWAKWFTVATHCRPARGLPGAWVTWSAALCCASGSLQCGVLLSTGGGAGRSTRSAVSRG